jgi:nicotinate-nucleotide adenylyltransferase
MVRAAIHDNYSLEVSDVEFTMPRPSYTEDTLAYLSDKHPDHAFRLIIGSDNLPSFHKWKNHEILLGNYGLYVYIRPGTESHQLFSHPNVVLVKAPLLDISATFIRKCIREGKPVRYLVPAAVEEMIEGKKFYQ